MPISRLFRNLRKPSSPGTGSPGGSFLGDLALEKLLRDYSFDSVLDIGLGAGEQAMIFQDAGKSVTGISLDPTDVPDGFRGDLLIGDYASLDLPARFDCIWACHVLEHQLRPNDFLTKLRHDLNPGGIIAVTVPPHKDAIVGGHVTMWNAGLLLYHLVLAGFDCSEAAVRTYGYNVSVITRVNNGVTLPKLGFCRGDLELLAPFLPPWLVQNANGQVDNWNW